MPGVILSSYTVPVLIGSGRLAVRYSWKRVTLQIRFSWKPIKFNQRLMNSVIALVLNEKQNSKKCHWTLLNEALFIHFHHFIVAINSFTGNVLFSGYEFSRFRERNQMNQDDLCGNNSKWKWTYHSLDQSFSLVQNEVGADWVGRLRLQSPRKQETPLGWSALKASLLYCDLVPKMIVSDPRSRKPLTLLWRSRWLGRYDSVLSENDALPQIPHWLLLSQNIAHHACALYYHHANHVGMIEMHSNVVNEIWWPQWPWF